MSTFDAWARAVAMTQRDKRKREIHPAQSLIAVLARFGAYGGSTSGVERLFSTSHRSSGICRADLSEACIDDELQLMCDVNEKETSILVEEARRIWVKIYGAERQTTARPPRLDVGKRSFADVKNKLKLAGWITRRRAHVDALVASKRPRVSLRDDLKNKVVGQLHWSEQQHKEQRFQENKRLVRFIESLEQGYSLPSEDTPGNKKALALWREHEHKVACNYTVNKKRLQRLRADKVPGLGTRKLFVENGCDVGNEVDFKRILRTHGLTRVHDRIAAEVFLVSDIHNPGQRICWCALLSGCMLCTLSYLKAGGHSGTSMAFHAALTTKRHVWCSDAFIAKHPEVHKILVAKMHSPGSRWNMIESKEAILKLGASRGTAGRGWEVVTFVTHKEQMAQDHSQPTKKCKL